MDTRIVTGHEFNKIFYSVQHDLIVLFSGTKMVFAGLKKKKDRNGKQQVLFIERIVENRL